MKILGRLQQRARLRNMKELAEQSELRQEHRVSPQHFSDLLGRAGYVRTTERSSFLYSSACISVLWSVVLCSAAYYFAIVGVFSTLLFSLATALLGTLCFLCLEARKCRQQLLFQLPMFLEAILLQVEAGMAVFPAVERYCRQGESAREQLAKRSDILNLLLREVCTAVYRGIPFRDALASACSLREENVLRHTFLHLDLSSSEGGSLSKSLRSLSEYAFQEWKHCLESRVNRLENWVIFPVFAAVLGLLLLVVAVPILPLFDFFTTLEPPNL